MVLAAIALVAVAATPAGAAPGPATRATASGSIGLRLLEAPAAAGNDPRARIYIIDHLAPDTVIERRIEISNSTASSAHILLYPSAATIVKGSFLGAAGHTPNDLSTWISVTPRSSDVLAGGSATASVTIAIPSDAPPGEHYGVVWAEQRTAPASGTGITQVSRVGIRIYLSVGSGGAPAADFTIDSLTAQRSPDGRPMIVATVHNTGGRALDMHGTLNLLHGPSGLSAGPFPATLGTTLAIDATEPVTIALDEELPAGPWDARITLQSGLLKRSARAIVTFPASGTTPPVTTSTGPPGWLYPGVAVLGFLLLLAIAAWLVARSRRRLPRLGALGNS